MSTKKHQGISLVTPPWKCIVITREQNTEKTAHILERKPLIGIPCRTNSINLHKTKGNILAL